MRLLLGAFACHPGRGSENGAGWAVATSAARAGNDVVLVTQPRHRCAIEAALASDPLLAGRISPVYVGLPGRFMEAWDRRAGLRGLQLYYGLWQLALFHTGRALHRKEPFDVAHHVTLTPDWLPSGLAWVRGLPLVWGPVGGGQRVPAACRRWLGLRGTLLECARLLTADVSRLVLGRAGGRRAALIVAQNEEAAARMRSWGPDIVVQPNVFVEPDRSAHELPARAGVAPDNGDGCPQRPKAMFAGRLVAWKGVRLALDVIARPEVSHWDLHFYGDGPERPALERAVQRRRLGHRVVFHGVRPRHEVRQAMAEANAFLYPSLRDSAPWVVAEALMAGCPVVCVDVAGPPAIVGEHRSGVVPPDRAVLSGLTQALLATEGAPRRPTTYDPTWLPATLLGWYRRANANALHEGSHDLSASRA